MIKGVVSLCATKYDKQNTPPGLNYSKRFCTDWVFDDVWKPSLGSTRVSLQSHILLWQNTLSSKNALQKNTLYCFNAGGGRRHLQKKNFMQSLGMQWRIHIKGLFFLSSPGVTGKWILDFKVFFHSISVFPFTPCPILILSQFLFCWYCHSLL